MASTYLSRTVSSASNRKTWTYSAWIKRSGGIGNTQTLLVSWSDANNHAKIRLESDKVHVFDITSGSFSYQVKTNRLLRDTNAWYHIVIAFDTTQGTASNRLKIYINGEQETSLAESSYPAQDYEGFINRNRVHSIGYNANNSNYFDGSMSHINLVDGTAELPTAFGQYDANGVWTIKPSPSVTYGTNGFFILKDGNSVTDQSGNGNNFTVGGGTLTQTEDNPSNVFAVWNNLMPQSATYTNANTSVNQTVDASYRPIYSTIATPTTGKFYAEFKAVSGFDNINKAVGFVDVDEAFKATSHIEAYTTGGSYGANGRASYNGTADTSVPQYTNGDIIGIALDLDNGKSYFHKNGTYINSGNPTTGSNGYTVTTGKSYVFVAIVINQGGSNLWSANFGNGYFGTTAVASAGTNASGNGIFEYDVPTNFTALSTKGLNL